MSEVYRITLITELGQQREWTSARNYHRLHDDPVVHCFEAAPGHSVELCPGTAIVVVEKYEEKP